VDGELSATQRAAVARLLQQSSEARELVRQLQENAHRLRELPRRRLEPDFADTILQAIADRQIGPVRPRAVARRRWVPAFAASAAAVLLIALFGGLYFYAELLDRGGTEPNDVPPMAKLPIDKPAPLVPQSHTPNPLIARLVEGVYSQYAAPIPPERGVTVAFADLTHDPGAAGRVDAELRKGPAVDLDVRVRDSARAVERLKAGLQGQGIKLLIDPTSAAALKAASRNAEYWLYAENVRPDELNRLLKQLATADAKAPFDKLAVTALGETEHRQVVALLGVDPDKLNGSSQGMIGRVPNPSKTPRPKTKERVAVVLPQSPTPRASEEVRQFLFQPSRPQAGTLRVLVKIHQD
jgi:hypothetical protein